MYKDFLFPATLYSLYRGIVERTCTEIVMCFSFHFKLALKRTELIPEASSGSASYTVLVP